MRQDLEEKYERMRGLTTQKNWLTETICLLFFFILLEPRYFFFIDGISAFFKYGVIAISIILFGWYVVFEWKKWSKMTFLCILYHAYLCFITLYRKADFVEAVQDSLFFCSLCILVEYCLKYNPKILYTKLLAILAVEVLINFLTVFIDGGLYSTSFSTVNFFLGYKNQMINIILPTLMLGYFYVLSQGKFSRSLLFILFVVSAITVWYVDSKASTLIVFLMLFPILCLCNFTGLFNMTSYLIVNVIGFVLVVLLQVQKKFNSVIEMIFSGRTATFSGRDTIWNDTISLIKQNPIWGYGVERYADRAAKYSGLLNFASLHAHDRFLETMYRGGIILLAIYVVMLLLTTYYLTKNRKLDASKILSFTLFVYLIGMITEFYRYSFLFFPMMVIAENIVLLQNSINNDLARNPSQKKRILGLWPKCSKE